MFRAKFYWAIRSAILALIILAVAKPSSALVTNYRSIGTNTNVLYSTGSAWILAGTTTVDFYSGAGLPSYIGKGDKLVIDNEEFYILNRESETRVIVQQAASADHIESGYTIKRSYHTLQSWENDRDGDLVEEDRLEVGVCYNDGLFRSFSRYVVLNTISMGNRKADFNISRGLQGYNISSDATATGWRSFSFLEPADQFISIVPGEENFHLFEGGNAIDTAVNLAFIYTDDIDGLERDDHSKWDIGADEYCIYSSGIWYVDSEKYGDGTSWDTAFETIQQAVSAAGPGEEIWVKQGTYLLSSEIRIDKSVSIFGCFKGTETQREQRNCRFNENVVDGQNSFRCFGINASDVTIDGFKIQNGDHDFGGGMYASETSSFTVSSCTFTSNHANDGGGFFNEAPQGDLVNCIFQNNTAVDNGGGLYILGSSLNVANCIFSGNEAGDAYGPGGGAIFNSNSSPKITNSTFSGNTARDNTEGGAIFNRFSHPQITNCILWGNIAGYGPEIVDDEMSSSTVSYTNIDWD